MTSMICPAQVMKIDKKGRVLTPAFRKEELLDEFERSGLSGPKFAALAGLKYQTFAAWVTRRRKLRGNVPPKNTVQKAPVPGWIEAVVDQPLAKALGSPLFIHLPGGARIEVSDGAQAALAAQVLGFLQKDQAARC